MKTIRFLVTVVDHRHGLTYESGSVRSMNDDSAYHWIKRSMAEEVSDLESVGYLKKSKDSFAKHLEESDDGDAMESASGVEEQNGGNTGERTEHVIRGRRTRQKKRI